LPCEGDGAGPFADGKTLDRTHLNAARANVSQASLENGGQFPAWRFEIVLVPIDWNPACNANENRDARAAHGFVRPASAGMRSTMAAG
jgi:hypothetical protein